MIQTRKQNFLRSMLLIKLRANMNFLTIFQKGEVVSVRHLQNCQSAGAGPGDGRGFSKNTKPLRLPVSRHPGSVGSSPSRPILATK